ncbi:hypothetical protein EUZ85_03695 [Hahella sp. KA22]|uniref:hypothetical protein n=1 Tax=Hahella sp. KA22 TaxID=1628392 RepID=UPI000FDE0E09|nr:hypothetical protein [Hahella sp. KA22]AZZ89860.1 hypothetical protein ENC22_01150 [Hahella sp. KA22]QAY53229.1 hypothetical protein EUZ85_03695 [Hahella sp. KA22]
MNDKALFLKIATEISAMNACNLASVSSNKVLLQDKLALMKSVMSEEGVRFWDDFLYECEEATEDLELEENFEGWDRRRLSRFIAETIHESGVYNLLGFPEENTAGLFPPETLAEDELEDVYEQIEKVQWRIMELCVAERMTA